MKEKPVSIAGRIRAAREQAQMAPAALRAELRKRGIDLSKTGLHRLETIEPTNPNLKIIEAIAEITKVSPELDLVWQRPGGARYGSRGGHSQSSHRYNRAYVTCTGPYQAPAINIEQLAGIGKKNKA